ncbi:MAG: cytochrome C biogenesis protein ResB [Firmicutes bacterium HGW-Firmicutes-21]|nr:MAG: cytochrome C biogenesis protein ResB [Firmicutes bacterium HGW-Firmicutes-21]
MQYLLTFLEGLISFVSPCILPMLPVYVSYLAGNKEDEKITRTLKNSVGFVLGFMTIFITLGLFAGTVGSFLNRYSTAFNIISGLIVIVFALSYLGVFNISFFDISSKKRRIDNLGFLSAIIFGMVFSISLTPCVGAFLGTALMQASLQGSAYKGALMLVFYSLGLGVPFILSALLINQLKGAFDFIKRHYKVIRIASGAFLIIVGILMMSGYMRVLFSLLT